MRFKFLFVSFLSLLFLVSMELFVFNAETLVALCFLLFVYLVVKYLGDSVGESLKEKSIALEREFNECFRLERQGLELISASYTKQLNLSSVVKGFFHLLFKVHAAYVEDVSSELAKYYTACIEQMLFQLRNLEEGFSRDLHRYYFQRIFVGVENVPLTFRMFQENFPMSSYSRTFINRL